MDAVDVPTSFPIAWGASAGGSYIRDIPELSQVAITPGAASLETGFPPLTFLAVGAGGIPPFGQDFNGILRQLTLWAQWQKAGGPIVYDAVFSAAIGGYPKGTILQAAAFGGTWLNLVDANTSDPDTGGANWRLISYGRLLDTQVFDAAGVFTYTALAGVNMIEIEGCGSSGAGGGTEATGVGQVAVGGGGGSGAFGRTIVIDAATFDGQTITISGGGVAVSGAAGGNGITDTSFGAFLVLPPGMGGALGVANNPPFSNASSNGASTALATGGSPITLIAGDGGGIGFGMAVGNVVSGAGAVCPTFGSAGQATGPGAGSAGTGNGAGGSGAASLPSTAARAGGNGLPGKLIIRGYSG